MIIDNTSTMGDLILALDKEYEIQRQIYNTYQKAAELDLDFKGSKDKELQIRRYIAAKVNV